jgi:hypothetical protein
MALRSSGTLPTGRVSALSCRVELSKSARNWLWGTLPDGHHPARRCCLPGTPDRVSARFMRNNVRPERRANRQFSILNSPLSNALNKYQSTRNSQLSTFGLTFQIREMYEMYEDKMHRRNIVEKATGWEHPAFSIYDSLFTFFYFLGLIKV